jgi:SAM-dependent methyltransferase
MAMQLRWVLVALLLPGLLPGAALLCADDPAAQTETSPPREYRGRRIAQTMHYTGAPWLTRESREREEDCSTMLQQLGVRPGMTVCDMGCGNGFYTLKLARLVQPGGRVLAVDIQPEMLRLLQAGAAEAELENIELIEGDVDDPKLPANQLDLILCVDVYHEFSHPEEMLAAMRAALKPDGRLVLVEFRAEDPDVPIKPLHKMSRPQVLKELEPNGFRLVHEFQKLPWQHMLFFQRSQPPAP